MYVRVCVCAFTYFTKREEINTPFDSSGLRSSRSLFLISSSLNAVPPTPRTNRRRWPYYVQLNREAVDCVLTNHNSLNSVQHKTTLNNVKALTSPVQYCTSSYIMRSLTYYLFNWSGRA